MLRSVRLLKPLRASLPLSVRRLSKLPPKHQVIQKFDFKKHTHTVKDIDADMASFFGKQITISGWIDTKPRKIGKGIVFATLRDFDGNFTQVVSKEQHIVDLVESAFVEDCVAITGKVERRRPRNAQDESVRWELNIDEYMTLNTSEVLTSQLESLKQTPNEFPQQFRYLQLRLPFYQQALKKRAHAATVVRSELGSMGFTEIETPLLFKSTPEGAREFLVPTRRKDQFYALPQSPQQYKQLLMASGVKNYFQIARCFRDEDLRADRQPEFTQVDLEMSFADMKDVQETVERVVKRIWKDVAQSEIKTLAQDGQVIAGDFVHLSYEHVLQKYGIDKPDLRSTLEFQCLEGLATALEDPEYPVFEVCILRGAFEGTANLPSKLFDATEYRNRSPVIVPISTEEDRVAWTEKFEHMAEFHDLPQVQELLGLQVGDVIAGSTRQRISYENPTPLGRFRQLAIAEFPDKWMHHNTAFIGAWVEDFPLFNPTELAPTSEEKVEYPQYDKQQFVSTHHPFTMSKTDDYDLLATDPLAVKGEHYDLVVNGVELGGGSRRVHDSEVQRYILEEILKVPDPDRLFGHLMKALSMGCPPHAGLALGFDRLCAMLIGSSSIRDVVAFPKTQNGSDLVVESPSSVTDDVLREYHIKKV